MTQDEFDKLLRWLDSDRERAGQKYEEIRFNLIRFFARRGCTCAEELADETFNRAARRALEVADSYVGDPRLYFYRIARNIFLEQVKPRPDPFMPPKLDQGDEKERRLDCLDHCLDHQSREIILAYYQDEKRAKIDHRKELAERLGITLNTLRMRTHRIKLTLRRCMEDCLAQDQKS